MAQPNLPPVPRVDDPDKYLESIFGTSKNPSVPSFFSFMEDLRGMPISKFSRASLETLALIMETTFYSQYANMIEEMSKQNSKTQAQSDQVKDWAQGASPQDVDGAIDALQQRIDQLKEHKEKTPA